MQEAFNYLSNWFTGREGELNIIQNAVRIVIIFIAIKIAIKIAHVLIDKFFKQQHSFRFKMEDKKADTLAVILKSVATYLLYFIGLVPILEIFGITPASILATAGIGGLAVGFGAQNLVKDVITGFFILFEDQYAVGDYIKTGEFDGIVEEIGIRTTRIRAFSGDLHIIPNGSIQAVTNRCRGAMRAWVDVSIAYEEDVDNAVRVLNDLVGQIAKESEVIVEGPTVLGVTNLGDSDVVLSVIAKTKPMEQWAVERILRKRIKDTFDREGIEIPYPRRVVINDGEN